MAVTVKSDITKLRKEIKDFNEEIKEEFRDEVIRISVTFFFLLIQFSPVDTGSYLASHRLGIGSTDNTATTFPKRSEDETRSSRRETAMPKAYSHLYSMLPKIDHLKPVFISNSIDWAEKIEYGGTSAGPDGVYRRAYHAVKNNDIPLVPMNSLKRFTGNI